MISPRHLRLLIRHLDCIDQVVASRLDSARPWTEPALTSQLCDLLDDETTDREKMEYSREHLRNDLESSDEGLSVALRVESIQYTPKQERWVTQADVGLIVRYEDRLSVESWETGWLLQAKRATPKLRQRPAFHARSRFPKDPLQHDRLQQLNGEVGVSFALYMLYCPRPYSLNRRECALLAQARNASMHRDIYDYTLGQMLFKEMDEGGKTLGAGILIAPAPHVPENLLVAHEAIMDPVVPFAWFIAAHFVHDNHYSPQHFRGSIDGRRLMSRAEEPPGDAEQLATSIVRGDEEAVNWVIDKVVRNQDREESLVPFLPAQTMTIEVSPGGALPEGQD